MSSGQQRHSTRQNARSGAKRMGVTLALVLLCLSTLAVVRGTQASGRGADKSLSWRLTPARVGGLRARDSSLSA